MKTGLGGKRGTPRGVKARLGLSFDAIKIGTPGVMRVEGGSEAGHRNGEFRGPGFCGSVLEDAATEFAMELLNRAVRDVEVNPKPIGRDFEFFVFEGIGGIGLEKSLGNIAVPELVAPAIFS